MLIITKAMGLSDIKKELKKLDKDDLIDLLVDLYKKNKSVKAFLDFYISPDEEDLSTKYRDKVFEAFFPKRGFGYNLKNGKQAITDFKKLGPSSEALADLMLFYVETGVKFTNEVGDINENFYSSLEKTYLQALTLIKKENLLDKFARYSREIEIQAEGIGWGFSDTMADIYCDFYDDLYDEPTEEACTIKENIEQ